MSVTGMSHCQFSEHATSDRRSFTIEAEAARTATTNHHLIFVSKAAELRVDDNLSSERIVTASLNPRR
jgi:hypothetical protein